MSAQDKQQKRLTAARKAKVALAEEYGACEWFRGVGIARSGDEWHLRLNVDPQAEGKLDLPADFKGVPIDVVHIGVYRKRQLSRAVGVRPLRPPRKRSVSRKKKA